MVEGNGVTQCFSLSPLQLLKSPGPCSARISSEESNYRLIVTPNPLSTSSTISISLYQSQNISLKIFDEKGRLVSALADKIFEAGVNEIVWDAENVTAGIYFLQLQTNETIQTEKLIVTK